MTSIGPDAPGPDLAALIRTLRHAVTAGPGRAEAASAAAAARSGRLGDLVGDGPAPAGGSPLGDVPRLLRSGLQRWGGPLPLARAVVAAVDVALARTPGTGAAGTGAAVAGTPVTGTAGAAGAGAAGAGAAGAGAAGAGAAGAGAGGTRVPRGTPATGGDKVGGRAGASPGPGAPPDSPGPPTGRQFGGATHPPAGNPADTVTGPRLVTGPGPVTTPPLATPAPQVAPPSPELATAPQPTAGAAVLQALLPAAPDARAAHLARAIGWLAENLDHPQTVAAGAAQLGPAAAALGLRPDQTAAVAVLLSDAARAAGMWPPREWAAWQSAVGLAAHWVAEGAAAAGYTPPHWSATVLGSRRHGADLAVLSVRTFLPYPYAAGQHTTVATGHHRDLWRPCWLAGAPRTDNLLELHTRADDGDAVTRALVHRVQPGDVIRLGPARGGLRVPAAADGVLLVAEDTGAAAVRAVREELRRTGDPRPTWTLYWVPPGARPYEEAFADFDDVTVVGSAVALADALAGRPELADWAAVVAGTPTGAAAAATAVAYAGVPADRTSTTQIGRDD